MSDRKAPVPPTKANSNFLLSHWSLFRGKLNWAYDQVMERELWEWPFVPYPTPAWLIRKGSITLRFPSGVEHFEAGTWVFPQESEGVQKFQKGTRIISLRFQAEWSNGLPIFDRSKTLSIPAREIPQLTEDAENLVAAVRSCFPDLRAGHLQMRGGFDVYLRLQPVFMKWIQGYHSTLTSYGAKANSLELFDDKVRLALHSIENRRLSTPLHEGDLANEVGCSVSQLNKAFVKQVGSTPAALWARRRLNAAKLELSNSSESIKAIAFNLGFSLPEHFSNWFRKNTQLSPREYRNHHQANMQYPL